MGNADSYWIIANGLNQFWNGATWGEFAEAERSNDDEKFRRPNIAEGGFWFFVDNVTNK